MTFLKVFRLKKVILVSTLMLLHTTFAQDSNELILNGLITIDSLMSADNDEAAKERLDELQEKIVNQPKETIIRYYALLGDFYLGTSQYEQSIEAYEKIEDLDTTGLTREVAIIQAKAVNDLGIAYSKNGEAQKAKSAHFKSLSYYQRYDDPQGRSFNYGNLAVIYKELKILDSAYYYYGLAEKAAVAAKDTLGIAFHALTKGILYSDNGEPIKAIESLNKARKVFKEISNDRMYNYTNRILATTYLHVEDYASARPLFSEVRDYMYSQKNKVQKGLIDLSIAEFYFKQKKYDSGYFYINEGIAHFDSARYVKGLSNGYSLLGQYFQKKSDYKKAKENIQTSMRFSRNAHTGMTVNSMLLLAEVAKEEGQYKQALAYADSVMILSRGSLPESSEKAYFDLMYRIYINLEKPAQALGYLERLYEASFVSYNQERANEIARIEYNYKLESEQERLELEKQQQAQLYEKELEKERLVKWASFGAGGLVLIILILLYRSYLIKQKRNAELSRKNELIKSKNNELTAKNEEISSLRETEKKMAEESLALKERELTNVTMLSYEKNELLQQIGDQIGGLSNKVDDKVIPDLKEIKQTIKSNISDETWNSFTYHFEQVHPEFFNKLKASYEDLNQNDLRLCAYIKVGLNNKVIAQMGNVTLAAVKKNINRLKKKMEIGPEDSLRDFMMGFI